MQASENPVRLLFSELQESSQTAVFAALSNERFERDVVTTRSSTPKKVAEGTKIK